MRMLVSVFFKKQNRAALFLTHSIPGHLLRKARWWLERAWINESDTWPVAKKKGTWFGTSNFKFQPLFPSAFHPRGPPTGTPYHDDLRPLFIPLLWANFAETISNAFSSVPLFFSCCGFASLLFRSPIAIRFFLYGVLPSSHLIYSTGLLQHKVWVLTVGWCGPPSGEP